MAMSGHPSVLLITNLIFSGERPRLIAITLSSLYINSLPVCMKLID